MIIPLLLWVITLYGNGTATVSLNTMMEQSVTLALPVQPQSYIMVTVNGSPWYYILNGSLITVPIFGTANVSITYVPHVFMENNFIGISVGNSTVEIAIPSDILIANITLSLINMTMSNNELIIIAKGPGEFLYTVMPTPAMHGATTIQQKTQITPYNETLMITMIIIIVTIVAFATYVLIIRRRTNSTKSLTTTSVGFNLNDYEVSILKYLESRGGSAFEIDISRDLGIPRTTVWRSVRRLEDLGMVRISKVEGKNMVTLIRRTR